MNPEKNEALNRRLQEARRPIVEAERRLLESPGFRIFSWCQYLRMSRSVFEANADELENWLAQLEDVDFVLQLWNVDQPDKMEPFTLEILRRLHNFSAGAGTLVDHTRVMVRKLYDGDCFQHEYQERVSSTFAEAGLPNFIQGLRNFILHAGFPTAVSALSHVADEGLSCSVSLPTPALLAVDCWKAEARRFITEAGESIEIGGVTSDYRHVVAEFYDWFASRQQEIHAIDLEDAQRLEDELVRVRRS